MQHHDARALLDALERGGLAVDQGHHDLAIARVPPGLHDDPVAVQDPLFHHGIPADLERVAAPTAAQPLRHLDGLGILQRLDRTAGGDAPEQGQSPGAFDGLAPQTHAPMPSVHGLDQPALDEPLHVLVHGPPGAHPHRTAELVEARGRETLCFPVLEAGIDVPLPAGQCSGLGAQAHDCSPHRVVLRQRECAAGTSSSYGQS